MLLITRHKKLCRCYIISSYMNAKTIMLYDMACFIITAAVHITMSLNVNIIKNVSAAVYLMINMMMTILITLVMVVVIMMRTIMMMIRMMTGITLMRMMI